MSLEDIKARVAAEQQKQSAEAARIKAEADAAAAAEQAEAEANAKTAQQKKDAARLKKERARLKDVISQLAKGGLEARAEATLTKQAIDLDASIENLRNKLKVAKAKPETMVGSLRESQVPFGGRQVGAVTGPISGGIDTTRTTATKPTLTPTAPSKTAPSKKEVAEGKGEPKVEPETKLTREEILSRYPIIDALFEQDSELRALLDKYLDPKSKMTLDQFKKELGQAQYNFKYADIIKQRLANKAVFDRLGASATGESQYERDVAGIMSELEATATSLGATVAENDIRRIAQNLYITGTEARPLAIERALTPFIKIGISPVTGRPTLSGQAGANYQGLLGSALANGISESLLPKVLGVKSADEVLRSLAEGASIRDYEQRFRDYAMNGRSDYVKNLLAQGMNLDVIMAPYRNVMADVLEIANPEQIKLDDPTLSMAFGEKEMTLTDFARALRKDTRWQYTAKAREEVSDAALSVLRDFGFQG